MPSPDWPRRGLVRKRRRHLLQSPCQRPQGQGRPAGVVQPAGDL
ncbi:hypothetical protein C4K27_4157 [Pseudomonas chlororaphis subsp. chlororaphis]|nr:hypothetical protein C4K27_4157 [Pseudomonas chlororaphis subsp. chlororaphis]